MPVITARRLKVRDDGTGTIGADEVSLQDFENEDAIVVLGNPGMGKTTLFKSIPGATFSTVRRFLVAPSVPPDATLFLDGLDEYRVLNKGQDASLKLAEALKNLGRPKFRISCRAADWYGSSDLEVLRDASASNRIAVLELLPFSQQQIVTAIQGEVSDATNFIRETEAAGLADLLGNPQTLDLIVRAWRASHKPRNKYDAYNIGVNELVREMNEVHAGHAPRDIRPTHLRAAAASAASTVLLSNISGVCRSEAITNDDYVHVSIIPHPTITEVDESLERRVFHSPNVHRFELIHRTIAEFLAAEDLATRISEGLPIDRVFALICGADGKPVSSLRGLFAWLMTRDSTLAASYASLDAYAVATYGDSEVLSPQAQRSLLLSLSELSDPWFLTNETDRSSFRGLANETTKDVILGILQDADAGPHSKIAMLEAIANSSSRVADFEDVTRSIALDKSASSWLRSKAASAYGQSVGRDSRKLEALDEALAASEGDDEAAEVRVSMLKEQPDIQNRAHKIVSIVDQVARRGREAGGRARRVVGRLYPLGSIAREEDFDEVIDGISLILLEESPDRIELSTIFDIVLARRLKVPSQLDPTHLERWLTALGGQRSSSSESTFEEVAQRFASDTKLFEAVFNIAFEQALDPSPTRTRLPIGFWQIVPPKVWPFKPADYLIERARSERNPTKAAALFRAYLSALPIENALLSTTEKAFEFLYARSDVQSVLGLWDRTSVPAWTLKMGETQAAQLADEAAQRSDNVRVLESQVASIQDGSNIGVLEWALGIYLCLNYGLNEDVDGRQRLAELTNEQLAESILEGFCRFIEHEGIPSEEQILQASRTNSTPYTHTLVALSLYLRIKQGLDIPPSALPACVAAVLTTLSFRDSNPDFEDILLDWLKAQFSEAPHIVEEVLTRAWTLEANGDFIRARRFYELKEEQNLLPTLARISGDVLEGPACSDIKTVVELLPFLLSTDSRRALTISEREASRPDLPIKLKAIWETALFVLSPSQYENRWKAFALGGSAFEWEILELLNGNDLMKSPPPSLTAAQRAAAIEVIGTRFKNTPPPTGVWGGHDNAWDAASFVGNQIGILAQGEANDGRQLLEGLLKQPNLESYHDVIRHHIAQREKKERDLTFSYSSPAEVAQALRNRAPATPMDLLAYVVDHLRALNRELKSTQMEMFRAYWNQSGKDLSSPKPEEDCSGLLAADLQKRIQPHGLNAIVEHHMVANKECDIVVLQGTSRLLPIEAKHHFNVDLWTAWRDQLDGLYTRDAGAGGLGIYLVYWSGERPGKKLPKLPSDVTIRPTNATELQTALESRIPLKDRTRLRVIVVDISPVE